MKRIVLTVTILLLLSVFAQAEISGVPQLVNYQGKLTDANGDPLPTAEYKLQFNVYDDATAGSIKWGPQKFESVPVVRGYFNVILGPADTGDRSIMGAFSGPNRYLGIKVNDGPEIQPRQQILSAPFSVVAGNVSFELKNTDYARIFFESTGFGEYESNIVFETYDDGDEGFIFRTGETYNHQPQKEIVRIDKRGLRLKPTDSNVEGAEILWEGAGSYKNWHQDIVYDTMRFWSDETGTGDTLVLKGNGNVGIGTGNPTAKLDVNGDIKTKGKKAITECRICFQQTVNNPQCGGEGIFCSGWSSNPGWSTAFFDDTDGREGGCKYQWKIECR